MIDPLDKKILENMVIDASIYTDVVKTYIDKLMPTFVENFNRRENTDYTYGKFYGVGDGGHIIFSLEGCTNVRPGSVPSRLWPLKDFLEMCQCQN